MKLSEEIKEKIRAEFKQFEEGQYAGKSKLERQELGQFFTPPELSIKMLEKFENLDGDILDPCAGAGGLLAACVLAGADPSRIYGIELDPMILKICKERLKKLGVPDMNIHLGNALDSYCYNFSENYHYPRFVQEELF